MIQKGFELYYNLMNTPFLENSALVHVLILNPNLAIENTKVFVAIYTGFLLWGKDHVEVQKGCLLDTQPPLLCYSRPHPSILTSCPKHSHEPKLF